jgi:hypothetical protein
MTATFNYTKTQIITKALRDINVIGDNVTPSSSQYNYVSDSLNLMIKRWEGNPAINLWKRRQAYLFPAYGTASYSLGTSGDNCTNSYVATNISTASTGTTLTVDSITGISSGDYIGIELDDGTRQWTTVNGAPSGSTITITATLTDTVAVDNTVIAYTTKINRPLRVLRATTKDLSNNSESMMSPSGYDEYFDLPVKTTPGRPNNFFYDRLISGSTPYTGTLYLYPVTNDVNKIITLSYQEPLYDMVNTTDYSDFPQEWLSPIIKNLSCEIAPFYGKYTELQQLKPIAAEELAIVQSFDGDDSPIRFSL